MLIATLLSLLLPITQPKLPPNVLKFKPEKTRVLRQFIQPVRGTITSKFGHRGHGFHSGVDIAAPIGTPVRATAAGVVFTRHNGGYGRFIDLKHFDGTSSRYAHAQRLLVRTGQIVKQGQIICLVGGSGHTTGAHLHFEIRNKQGKPLNPMYYL